MDCCLVFIFYYNGVHRDLRVLTHSIPSRRSSDLEKSASGSAIEVSASFVSGSALSRSDSAISTSTTSGSVSQRIISGLATSSSAGASAGRISGANVAIRSEEHTSELQSLMRISYAVFCLKKKKSTYKVEKQ